MKIKQVIKKEWDGPAPIVGTAPAYWWIVMVILFAIYFLVKLGVV